MSTPRTPNQKKQYAVLNARLNKYTKLIEQLYAKYNREAAVIALRTDYNPHDGKMFRFKDYPQTRAAINELLTEYASEIVGTINRGTAYEWRQSNEFQDLLANKVLRGYGISEPKTKEYRHYFQSNSDQLKAFQQRQISGMNLSQRVWDLRGQYKEELEMALSLGIEQGISANALASQMKKYLNDPDKLFRRVRDEFSNLQLSKNAKAYHPGRGVYRSSFKNAQRLTRSEINMAYRTAEQTRWQQFDFVVGYEIKLSQRHPCHDVCDELAGRYPKDFVWTGWHPNDMCYAVAILKTDDEFWRDLGQDPDEPKEPSVNEVTELPENFKEWVSDNADRIEVAEKRGTQPYFIRDNREVVNEVLKPIVNIEATAESKLNPLQQNMQELAAAIGVAQGKPMSFDEANEMRGNPRYAEAEGHRVNCQSTVVANELRRRGFDVEALPALKGSTGANLALNSAQAWVDENGNVPQKMMAGGYYFKPGSSTVYYKTSSQMMAEFDQMTKEAGRYHVNWNWKRVHDGHIIVFERYEDGSYLFYDPQTGIKSQNLVPWRPKDINTKNGLKVLRVDNLKVNIEMVKGVVCPSGYSLISGNTTIDGLQGTYRHRSTDVILDIQHRWNERKLSNAELNGDKPGLIIHPDRRAKASISKQEQLKFDKEYRMATVYSRFGHQVEMLQEISGVSSPDAIIDGIKVDFKSLSSANNIERHAKDAIFKQGADEVWFEFDVRNEEILKELNNLAKRNIHGRYYFKNDSTEYHF